MNWPLGRPVAVYGLKLRTKAGSPDPVMTRQLCAVVRFAADGALLERSDAADTVARTSTASTTRAPIAVAASARRLGDRAERDMRDLQFGSRPGRSRKCSGT